MLIGWPPFPLAGLPENISDASPPRYAVKLAPTNCDLVAICWVNRNGRLIGSVADDIVAVGIDVHLETDEGTEVRDHSRPSLEPVNVRRRVIVSFERLTPIRGGGLCRLTRGNARAKQQAQTNEKARP
jgi:hypothetical protein